MGVGVAEAQGTALEVMATHGENHPCRSVIISGRLSAPPDHGHVLWLAVHNLSSTALLCAVRMKPYLHDSIIEVESPADG